MYSKYYSVSLPLGARPVENHERLTVPARNCENSPILLPQIVWYLHDSLAKMASSSCLLSRLSLLLLGEPLVDSALISKTVSWRGAKADGLGFAFDLGVAGRRLSRRIQDW